MWETLDEEAAEAVRSQLVVLRGGAPFLSPDDARLLGTWLSEGWSSAQIIHALERAADARRRRPRRTPLSLRSARRHLGKRAPGALDGGSDRPAASGHPLADLVEAVRAQAEQDARSTELRALAAALSSLPADDLHLLEARAGTLCRDFLRRTWEDLEPWEREARTVDARASLASLEGVLSAEAMEASAEEIARDQVRQSYPLLSAATIRQALGLASESPR